MNAPANDSVYHVCMARVNIYLPDELAARAREAGLNVSAVAREAIEHKLSARATNDWLQQVTKLGPTGITHEQVMEALDEVREEAGDVWP